MLFLNRFTDPASLQPTARLLQDVSSCLEARQIAVSTISAAVRDGRDRSSPRAYGRLLSLWVMFWRGLFIARPDLIICKSDPPMILAVARLLGLWHRCRVIYWCQDLYPDILRAVDGPALLSWPMAWLCMVLRGFHGWLMRGVVLRIVPSAGMADGLKRHDGVSGKAAAIVVQPNWPEPALRPMPWPDGKPLTVLYSGHYGYGHDLQDLIVIAEALEASDAVRFQLHLSERGLLRWQRQHGHMALPDNMSLAPLVGAECLSKHLADAHIHVVAIDDRVSQALMPSKATAAFRLGRPIMLLGGASSSLRQDIEEHGLGLFVHRGKSLDAAEWLAQASADIGFLDRYRAAVLAFDQRQQSIANPAHMARFISAQMSPLARVHQASGVGAPLHQNYFPDNRWEGHDA